MHMTRRISNCHLLGGVMTTPYSNFILLFHLSVI